VYPALLTRVLKFRYAAGADTSLTTLTIFVLLMVLNPEIQEKARKELDRVIGRDRLPRLSDRGTLPYIERLFYETIRHVEFRETNFEDRD
jgi:cytochrome P450